MNEHLDHRVTRLEFRVDGHDKDIHEVKKDTSAMSEALRTIQDNLKQIKWLIVGGAFATSIHYLGIPDALKLLLSVL